MNENERNELKQLAINIDALGYRVYGRTFGGLESRVQMNTKYKTDWVCDEKTADCNGAVDEYLLPDGTPTLLCQKHATGLFCLTCGSFIGGTEDIFVYGRSACSMCADDGEFEW